MILRPLKPRRKKKEIAHHTSIFKIVPITTMILHGCFIRQRGRRPRAQRFRISSWPLAKGAQGSRDAHASLHHALHSLLGAKVAPCLGIWEKPQMGVCLVSNDISLQEQLQPRPLGQMEGSKASKNSVHFGWMEAQGPTH